MTTTGHRHVQTPLGGLVEAVLAAPKFVELTELAASRPDELGLVGPVSAQLFVACALARTGPLLVVTATGRELSQLDEFRRRQNRLNQTLQRALDRLVPRCGHDV